MVQCIIVSIKTLIIIYLAQTYELNVVVKFHHSLAFVAFLYFLFVGWPPHMLFCSTCNEKAYYY